MWQPLGFGNVFEMPSGMPVTPETMKRVDLQVHEVSFHRQRFMAVIARNGVTRQDLAAGYFELAGEVSLQPMEIAFYQSLGITL